MITIAHPEQSSGELKNGRGCYSFNNTVIRVVEDILK